jgi:hypothetical protein
MNTQSSNAEIRVKVSRDLIADAPATVIADLVKPDIVTAVRMLKESA